MSRETKIIILAFVIVAALAVGGAFLLSGKSGETPGQSESLVLNIEATPGFYELGEVPINGGIVTKEYEVKNTTDKSIKLSRIATSCMCTTASVKIGDKETRFFGMEGHSGDKNPPVNLELKNGETAKIAVKFDPAAHGPQGVGPFDRIVWLYFNEGVKELKFNGTVVK